MPTPAFIARLRTRIGNDLLLVPTVVVIARDSSGRVLLVQDSDSGHWTLPGGIIEPDEVPADAAVREVWEEAAVSVELTRLIGVIGGKGCSRTYANGDQLAWVATVFGARITGGTLAADGSETTDARFFLDAELLSLSLNPHCRLFFGAEQKAAHAGFFEPPTWVP